MARLSNVFVIRVYYKKLGRMLNPLVLKSCPDLSSRLKDKNGPREAETDSRYDPLLRRDRGWSIIPDGASYPTLPWLP